MKDFLHFVLKYQFAVVPLDAADSLGNVINQNSHEKKRWVGSNGQDFKYYQFNQELFPSFFVFVSVNAFSWSDLLVYLLKSS